MAKAASQSQFEQVNALYEERQRFEAWLAALEAKRASTPVHIYTRVHGDYNARLQRVVEELRTHRTSLQELESTLIDRLTALDGDEAKHRDEAAEAELRAMVGELAADSHTEVAERTNGAIAQLSEERGRMQAELSQLRHLLDVGTAPMPVIAVASEPARVESVAPEPPRIRPVDAALAAPAVPAKSPLSPPADWELSFENAIISGGARVSESRSGEKEKEKAPESTTDSNPFDDLEFLKTMVDRNTGEHAAIPAQHEQPAQQAAAPAPAVPAPEPLVTMPASPPVRERPGKPAPVVASGLPLIMPDEPSPSRAEPRFPQSSSSGPRDVVPSYLKESPPEQVKTLKCQECGTLNYPTEWYCERCGAELAAL